jgi:hypothetical protein
VATINGGVGKSAHPTLHRLHRAAGNFVLARFHFFHIDVDGSADFDPVLPRAPRQLRRVGACHQRLGRDAARVDAGAAEKLALDDRHFHPCSREACRQRRSSLARADHDRVESHRHNLASSRFDLELGFCSSLG